jgi:hypothetical protein
LYEILVLEDLVLYFVSPLLQFTSHTLALLSPTNAHRI